MILLFQGLYTGLVSLNLGPLVKSFLKRLLSMIRKSPVTIWLLYLSAKGELLHLDGSIPGFDKNSSKSNVYTYKMIEIEDFSR